MKGDTNVKITKKLLIIVVSAIVLCAIVAFFVLILNRSDEKTIITSADLREVISISELSTSEFFYNGIVPIPSTDNPEKIICSVKYDSTVKVGVDSKDIDFKIDQDNKTITPILPEIKINDVLISESSISTIPANATVKLKDTLIACKEDSLNEANQKSELVELAKSNLKDAITALLAPIIKETEYTLVW